MKPNTKGRLAARVALSVLSDRAGFDEWWGCIPAVDRADIRAELASELDVLANLEPAGGPTRKVFTRVNGDGSVTVLIGNLETTELEEFVTFEGAPEGSWAGGILDMLRRFTVALGHEVEETA